MMLSTTNHPPFKVPDNEKVKETNFSILPDYIKKDSSEEQNNLLLQTYQYAADNLGKFVLDLDRNGWLKNTIVAATGDHNVRLKYIVEGNWHHVFGVPIIFRIPDDEVKQFADTSRWASHRDIIPSLLSIATNEKLIGSKEETFLLRIFRTVLSLLLLGIMPDLRLVTRGSLS